MEAFPIFFRLDGLNDVLPNQDGGVNPSSQIRPSHCSPHGSPCILESTRIDEQAEIVPVAKEYVAQSLGCQTNPDQSNGTGIMLIDENDPAPPCTMELDTTQDNCSLPCMSYHLRMTLTVNQLVSPLPSQRLYRWSVICPAQIPSLPRPWLRPVVLIRCRQQQVLRPPTATQVIIAPHESRTCLPSWISSWRILLTSTLEDHYKRKHFRRLSPQHVAPPAEHAVPAAHTTPATRETKGEHPRPRTDPPPTYSNTPANTGKAGKLTGRRLDKNFVCDFCEKRHVSQCHPDDVPTSNTPGTSASTNKKALWCPHCARLLSPQQSVTSYQDHTQRLVCEGQ
ncbi:hypothetical protein TNIN_402481 [Trichonephila inaurata madagascariensis]|uniref:Uncharacterized protein n=1 Tax=Trichonephila inaurata madagascariensis TaxID=2747483 RepID=A0A8X7CU22_9ARAC|nr:hypothetical protein TNIN_402481 [Trichonephila inaurata madagascariensis]